MTIRSVLLSALLKYLLTYQQNQRVAVIGNGSSGIQIVPGMLPEVTRIDHYVRSRTWVSPTFAREHVDKHGKGLDNCKSSTGLLLHCPPLSNLDVVEFTPEEIENFKKDHAAYQKFRKGNAFCRLMDLYNSF